MAAGDKAIEASGLEKRYRDVVALAGVDLEVRVGHRLRPARAERRRQDDSRPHPDDARSRPTPAALALPVSTCAAKRRALRERIGLAGQYAAVDENLTGFENLEMVGRLYRPRPPRGT